VHALADEHETARSGRPARAAAAFAAIVRAEEAVAALPPKELTAMTAQPSITHRTNLIRAHNAAKSASLTPRVIRALPRLLASLG
jgi:hypothetical protein